MRAAAFLLLTSIALAAVPALASANRSHGDCGTSDWSFDIDPRHAGADVWTNQCVGAAQWMGSDFQCRGPHIGPGATHMMVLSRDACETGILVGPF